MATQLYRLGKWCYAHRLTVIGIWLLLLVGIGTAAMFLKGPTSESFSIPGIPSEKAQNLMTERFPEKPKFDQDIGATFVIAAPQGHTLSEPQYQQAIDQMISQLKQMPDVKAPQSVANPYKTFGTAEKPGPARKTIEDYQVKVLGRTHEQAAAVANVSSPINPAQTAMQLGVKFDYKAATDVPKSAQNQLNSIADQARSSGLTVNADGLALQTRNMGGSSELIGIAVAAVVLIITFASLVAWGMPIITALIGLAVGSLGVQIATGFIKLSSETSILATMIGLAVGIDYALFIVSRYRHEVLEADTRAHAAGRAVGTAGSAVVFAGTTVFIALAALAVVNIPFLTAMGLAAAGTVVCAVLVALTLLPAILGLFGTKAFAARLKFLNAPDVDRSTKVRNSNGRRWITLISRHPWPFAIIPAVILLALAIPALGLKLGLPNDGTGDPNTTQRKAYDMVSEYFGPGYNGPLVVVVDGSKIPDKKERITTFNAITDKIGQVPNVKSAQIGAGDVNKAGNTAIVSVIPTSGPNSQQTHDLLNTLRNGAGPIESQYNVSLGVTGQTAIEQDVSSRLSSALVPYLLIVVGLAFLLLIIVFRSLLVPLTAGLGFLLSVAATFGATVAIFQHGDLGIINNPQPIVSFLPILLIGVVFGLAMDYQVFLVTRMREEYVHGEEARKAVIAGFVHGSRVVAGAAAIMMSVFAAFMLNDMSFIKAMGFALASAVFFDAFVIRMTVIPAVLTLLGDRAWWLPSWLHRVVPRVDVEGEKLAEYLATKKDAGDLEPVNAAT